MKVGFGLFNQEQGKPVALCSQEEQLASHKQEVVRAETACVCTVVTSRGRERQVELFKQLSQSNGLVPTAGDLDSGAEQIFSEYSDPFNHQFRFKSASLSDPNLPLIPIQSKPPTAFGA